MNLKTKTLLLAAPLALAMRPVADEIDLTPRFQKGQTYVITNAFSMEMGLDDISILVDGNEMGAGAIEMDMEIKGQSDMTEEILEVRDGKIAKMNVTVDTQSVEVTGEVNAMGQGEAIDESPEAPTEGRTVEVTIGEDGEVTRKDVTKDVEPLGDAELATVSHQNHFEIMVPKNKVEVGAEFELQPDWDDMMKQVIAGMESSDMPAEAADAMEAIMNEILSATEFDAVGKVTAVEDGIATVEYEVEVTMNIDDLMELIMQAVPPDAVGEIPPVNATLEVSANMTGTGKFNVAASQFNAMEMTGEFEVNFKGDADLGGAQGEASATLSGEFQVASTITLQ